MYHECAVAVIIPALNEAEAIGKVIAAVPDWVDDILVADNGSTDGTGGVAVEAGARVVSEPRRGYGSACLAALAALTRPHLPDVVVFLDGDYSDHPEEMSRLVDPIARGEADLVIGSRVLGTCERGALTVTQRFGNWLSCALIRLFWGARHTDLGPFRAIRRDCLDRLDMRDPDYGWTVEMQVKAAQRQLRTVEVPVCYRPRIGQSKVSGTLRGVWGAGTKILYTILATAVTERQRRGTRGGKKLIVFMKYPQPGRVKTRLIPEFGPDRAAALHSAMSVHTLQWARAYQRQTESALEVRFDGGSDAAMQDAFGRDLCYVHQGPGDLGERMMRAAGAAFAEGHAAVVIVGTDCPDLSAAIAGDAFAALDRHDVVLGPAQDGGYYLIGLRRAIPTLFNDMAWGTRHVLNQTRQRAITAGAAPILLRELCDVDRPADLPVWERVHRQGTA